MPVCPTNMAVVPHNRQTIVKEYLYFTNDVYTGKLFLLDCSLHDQMVSFQSVFTGLRTEWHGYWDGDEVSLRVHFDYRGNRRNALRKWADVSVERRPGVHPERIGIMKGIDHDDRYIELRASNVHYFDANTREYVVQPGGIVRRAYGVDMTWEII